MMASGVPFPRITTGIPGLDPILEGGLLSGGVFMVQGAPGTGKTILANQLGCHHVSTGGRAIYFTLLAESHARMIGHLRRMTFFRTDLVGDALVYLAGYKVLEEDGLAGLVKLLSASVAERGASLLVVDGLATAGAMATNAQEFKRFVHEVQTFSTSLGCTTLLLSSSEPATGMQAEHTLVDGIIELSDDLSGRRSLRHIQVRKMRGTRQVRGLHTVEISDHGLAVHARFEASLKKDGPKVPGPGRQAFGIEQLDKMLMGGVPTGSITMLLAASGCGKTTLMLQHLAAGAANGERGLYFGFYEHPAALIAKCNRIGVALQAGVDAGTIELMRERPIEGVLDVLASRLIKRVRDTGVARLCIDGLHTLFRTVDFPERVRVVTAALAEQLEGLGVTTLYSLETPDLLGREVTVPIDDLSALAHNVIVIRYIEREARFDRMLAILKMRDSDYDRSMHELRITDQGIELSRFSHPSRHVAAQPADRSELASKDGARKAAKSRHR